MIYKKGDFIGQKYEVYDVLGEGGFGIVYLVYSHEPESVYALKTFRDEYLEDAQTRDRFKKECQIWIDLERHPYLVRAYSVDEISGRLFIAMEYIASDEQGLNSLYDYLILKPPDLAQSLRWAIQFCYGIEYAYSKGIKAHRDIKPANIMIGQDKAVKISDFGLAGVIGSSRITSGIKVDIQKDKVGFSCQTMEGTGFGTPTHMPPEQFINAADCDERSDIYSFGIVLFQMITGGKLPFLAALPKNNAYEESRRFWVEMYNLHNQATVPKLNSPLFPIIQRCLEKEQKRRYQSFKELRSDLESMLKKQTGEVINLPEIKELELWELVFKGFSFNKLGKDNEAIACYEQALTLNPLFEEAWNNKGNSLKELGKLQESIFCYDKALEINPKYKAAWNNKGISLIKLGKIQEAIDCYDKAIEIDHQFAEPWFNKGFDLSHLGKYQEALVCYDKGLKIKPKDFKAWYQRGGVLMKLKRPYEAIKCYDRSLSLNPVFSYSWQAKGDALAKLDKYTEAIACYDRTLTINPVDEFTWHQKGFLLENYGYYQEAIACYDRSLEINPRYVEAWYNKGVALDILGKPQEAIASFNRVLEINPRDVGAWYNKARVEDGLDLKKTAILSYKKFIELAPAQYAEDIEYARLRVQELEEK